LDRLVLFADLARAARSTRAKTRAINQLRDTSNRVVTPKFDVDKLRAALTKACIETPDFGDPVVFESNKGGSGSEIRTYIHLNGTFDLGMLEDAYFARDRDEIDVGQEDNNRSKRGGTGND